MGAPTVLKIFLYTILVTSIQSYPSPSTPEEEKPAPLAPWQAELQRKKASGNSLHQNKDDTHNTPTIPSGSSPPKLMVNLKAAETKKGSHEVQRSVLKISPSGKPSSPQFTSLIKPPPPGSSFPLAGPRISGLLGAFSQHVTPEDSVAPPVAPKPLTSINLSPPVAPKPITSTKLSPPVTLKKPISSRITSPPVAPKKPIFSVNTSPSVAPKKPIFSVNTSPSVAPKKPIFSVNTSPSLAPKKPIFSVNTSPSVAPKQPIFSGNTSPPVAPKKPTFSRNMSPPVAPKKPLPSGQLPLPIAPKNIVSSEKLLPQKDNVIGTKSLFTKSSVREPANDEPLSTPASPVKSNVDSPSPKDVTSNDSKVMPAPPALNAIRAKYNSPSSSEEEKAKSDEWED